MGEGFVGWMMCGGWWYTCAVAVFALNRGGQEAWPVTACASASRSTEAGWHEMQSQCLEIDGLSEANMPEGGRSHIVSSLQYFLSRNISLLTRGYKEIPSSNTVGVVSLDPDVPNILIMIRIQAFRVNYARHRPDDVGCE